jgi:hypothetical protein
VVSTSRLIDEVWAEAPSNVRELNPGYYADASEPKAISEVPGAAHTGGIEIHPREYEEPSRSSTTPSCARSADERASSHSDPLLTWGAKARTWAVKGSIWTANEEASGGALCHGFTGPWGRWRLEEKRAATELFRARILRLTAEPDPLQ